MLEYQNVSTYAKLNNRLDTRLTLAFCRKPDTMELPLGNSRIGGAYGCRGVGSRGSLADLA